MNDEERLRFIAQLRTNAQRAITSARQSIQTADESLKQAERELTQCANLGDLNARSLAGAVQRTRTQLTQVARSLR